MRFNSSAGWLAGGTVFYILTFGVPAAEAAKASKKAAPTPTVMVAQGGVARWSGLAAKECGVFGKKYLAVDAVCYFPIDLRTKPGRYQIALWDQDGKRHVANAAVEEGDFAEEAIDLPTDLLRYVDISASDSARMKKESVEVSKVLNGQGGAPHFSLPLGAPAASLPDGGPNFGSTRIFNGKLSSFHTGRDYPVSDGSEAKAVADGIVVLVADHFLTGNAVYLDHGDGLVSMTFHLKTVAVKQGDVVKRGAALGTVGSTGRATGPHLHLGIRWQGKRIEPNLLLNPPAELPGVGEEPATSTKKVLAPKKKSKPGLKPAEDEG